MFEFLSCFKSCHTLFYSKRSTFNVRTVRDRSILSYSKKLTRKGLQSGTKSVQTLWTQRHSLRFADTMCSKREKKKAFPHPTPLDNVVTMVKQPNFVWRLGSRLFSLPKYTSTSCLSDESLKKFVADCRWHKKSQTCKTTNLLGHLGHRNEIPIE